MTSTTVAASEELQHVREVLRTAHLRLPSEVEVWGSGAEVLLKVAVAPGERLSAAGVPGRVQRALHAGALSLATAVASTTPEEMSPVAALGAGHSVRVVFARTC